MSFQTWHNYGYGICVDSIPEAPVERMNALLDHAPDFRANVEDWFAENNITEPEYEDYMAYDDVCLCGLASILSEVIEEAEGVVFTACSDFDGVQYLIYQPSYPWERDERERSLTKEQVEEILNRYVSILTDEEIEIDDQSVENGG